MCVLMYRLHIVRARACVYMMLAVICLLDWSATNSACLSVCSTVYLSRRLTIRISPSMSVVCVALTASASSAVNTNLMAAWRISTVTAIHICGLIQPQNLSNRSKRQIRARASTIPVGTVGLNLPVLSVIRIIAITTWTSFKITVGIVALICWRKTKPIHTTRLFHKRKLWYYHKTVTDLGTKQRMQPDGTHPPKSSSSLQPEQPSGQASTICWPFPAVGV